MRLFLMVYVLLSFGFPAAAGNPLERSLGRNETRVWSASFPLVTGGHVQDLRLADRLDRLGYQRVHRKPEQAGEYFWGQSTFWIFSREHRREGREYAASLIGLLLDPETGLIVGARGEDDRVLPLTGHNGFWIEPELLAESLDGSRGVRVVIPLEEMPEVLWRSLLAAEDSRFFSHPGLDARALARATISNLRSGRVSQGGSTITQQLIKNRDLTPKRTLGRKLSEAARAYTLESQYTKEQILEAYLNQVYLGHADGKGIYGVQAGAQAYFSRPVAELTLAQSALLMGMVQGPNRLHPGRHPAAAKKRRNWVLERLQKEGWADTADATRAQAAALGYLPGKLPDVAARSTLIWLEEDFRERQPRRAEEARGLVAWTTIDPLLQQEAQEAVRQGLRLLRRKHRELRDQPLSAALVALDRETGAVLAAVGSDPANPDQLDRVRHARRQPGSTVKPFVMLEALADCGDRSPLTLATRVADRPVTVLLDSEGEREIEWRPRNPDGRYRGPLSLRRVLVESRNVPTVRIAAACGFDAVADRLRRSGFEIPDPPPPSFVLGAVESTPLELASAYTAIAGQGLRWNPFGWTRLEKPGGATIDIKRARRNRVADATSSWLVRDALREAVQDGTGQAAAIKGLDVAAKTGTTNNSRDAWLAGFSGSVVTVVWVGLDDGSSLGLTGAAAAAPIWKSFMKVAVPARPVFSEKELRIPLEQAWVDPSHGWSLKSRKAGSIQEWFRRGTVPPRKRWWRRPRIDVLEVERINLQR